MLVSGITVDNKSRELSIDELQHICSYVGDRKTLSALYKASKNCQNAVLIAQIQRIHCFALLRFITDLDTAIYNLSKRHEVQSQVKALVIKDEPEWTKRYAFDSKTPDYRIPSILLNKYVNCIEKTPTAYLSHVFAHIKEDIIDALSEYLYSNRNICSITLPKYPSISAEYVHTIPHEFEVNDILEKALKREVGNIFLDDTPARFFTLDPIACDGNNFPVDAQGRYCLVHEAYQQIVEPMQVLGVQVRISATRDMEWFRRGGQLALRHHSFPSVSMRLPVSLFIGKKEGDTLQFIYKDRTVHLRICQYNDLRELPIPLECFIGEAIINSFQHDLYLRFWDYNSKLPCKEAMLQTIDRIHDQKALDTFNTPDDQVKKELLDRFIYEITREKTIDESVQSRSYIESENDIVSATSFCHIL